MAEHIRSSQRAPLSCRMCARRKVRCNKRTPCSECIRRGLASLCDRERVMVKGRVIESHVPASSPTYDDLVHENRRLKDLLTGHAAGGGTRSEEPFVLDAAPDFEHDLFERAPDPSRQPTVASIRDIDFPSRPLSEYLLTQGGLWTSWIHFALHHPTFEAEHQSFWEACPTDEQRAGFDPSWLAIYFSFISAVLVFADPIDISRHPIYELDDAPGKLQKWFDSAIFYLQKADFLRSHDIRTVQAIAILGIVFNNVGEHRLHLAMWASAVRIAQTLKMDDETHWSTKSTLERELCRRLWWTLVICEWLAIPYRPPCINENDFHVQLPAVKDDDEIMESGALLKRPTSSPRPIHYHLFMIRLAKVYHQFRSRLKIGTWTRSSVGNLVQLTDDELAHIISDLPPYLQADYEGSKRAQEESSFPWIPWQRAKIALILLNYRVLVNKILQNIWSDDLTFQRVRAICLSSSRAIISLVLDSGVPHQRMRTWSITLELFSAAVTLIIEAQLLGTAYFDDETDPVRRCCEFLRANQEGNYVAAAALRIIETMIHENDP